MKYCGYTSCIKLSYNVTKPIKTVKTKYHKLIPKTASTVQHIMSKFNINDTELSASFKVIFNVWDFNILPLIIRAAYLKYKVTDMWGYPFLTGSFSHFSHTGERERICD